VIIKNCFGVVTSYPFLLTWVVVLPFFSELGVAL